MATPGSGIVASVESHGDAVVLAVVGDVDVLTASQLTDAVVAVLKQGPRTVVVDLTKVEFLASAGLSALVDSQREAGQEVRFRVVAAGSVALRPIEMTGLTEELAVFPSRDEALAD